jgi:hypothetical protein
MLYLQLLSTAIALFTFTSPSLCNTIKVLNPPHARVDIPSIDFHNALGQHLSPDVPTSMHHPPPHRGLAPTRTTKRGPRIIEYKLLRPKGTGNAKRATGPNSPALFSFPNCLLCTGKRRDDMGLTVANNFQADQMVGMMLLGGMTGECLFCRLRCLRRLIRVLTAPNRWSAAARRNVHAYGQVAIKSNYRVRMSTRTGYLPDDLGKSSNGAISKAVANDGGAATLAIQ